MNVRIKEISILIILISLIGFASIGRPKLTPVYKVRSFHVSEDKQVVTTSGSAVCVRYKGRTIILTAAHNVKDRFNIQLLINNQWTSANIKMIDSVSDLCQLTCDVKMEGLEMIEDKIGDVTLLGFPEDKDFKEISTKAIRRFHANHVYTLTREQIKSGMSGGAVVRHNRLCGIVVAREAEDTSRCLYVPTHVISLFLENKLK